MSEQLEQRAKRYYGGGNFSQDDIERFEREGFNQETATVHRAYFGRSRGPMVGGRAPLGLNIEIRYDSYGVVGLTLTAMEDIEGLMGALDANTPEEMLEKRVMAYRPKSSQALVAISAIVEEEKGE
jgi:hypothetical protein